MCLFIETIRIENGRIYNIDYHTERFNRTRATFGKDVARIRLADFISPPSCDGILKCRVAYGKEIEEISYTPYQMKDVNSLRLISSDIIDYTYKTADRTDLNTLFVQRGLADDVLIVKNGYLTDTSIANVALYNGTNWFTPAHPLLRGTKRAQLLHDQLIVEKDIPWMRMGEFSKIMLFNAMIDWKQIILPIDEKHLFL